jgi:hypothetical protein
MPISLAPLCGGGFLVAFLQIVALYYPAAILLHYIVPSILPVKTIQVQPRNPGDITRDALGSIGEPGLSLCSPRTPQNWILTVPRTRCCRPNSSQGWNLDFSGATAQQGLWPAVHRPHR